MKAFAAKTIDVGVHPTLSLFGLTINYDVVMSTLFAMVIVLTLVFLLTRRVTDGVPSKLQVLWEMILEMVTGLATSVMGERGKRYVPLGVTLFVFILTANWLGILPTAMHPGQSGDILPAPTSDINLPLAMAAIVILWVHVESFRSRGFRGYFKHYAQPSALMTPINIIEEITKPITMTFRLFGNLFSGVIMISVITTLLPVYAIPVAEIVWKPFDDLFIGAIQAYIFMLLAIMYFGMATSHEESHDQQMASH